MKKRGSITVYLSLVLSLLVSLAAASLVSVQMQCARVQIDNAMEVGLYSLFAQYDRYLLEKYHLFYLDGSFLDGPLNLGAVYDTAIQYMEPVLKQNYQNLKIKAGGITSYRLATDFQGLSFQKQASAYMKKTMGAQAVHALLDQVREGSNEAEEKQEIFEEAQNGNTLEEYDQAVWEAQQEAASAEEEVEIEEVETETEIVETETEVTEIEEVVENPIDTIRRVMDMGILELVLQNPSDVSQNTEDLSKFASQRRLKEGLASEEEERLSPSEKILFYEYMIKNTGNYLRPERQGLLQYSMEYILGEKESDVDNLQYVANRLLAIREGINFVYLLGDSAKRAEASALAAAIAASLMIPMAESLVEMLLLVCWAFAESVLDVRELFAGGKTPLVKTSQTWQISLSNLGELLERKDSDRREDENGMSYEDYLRVLLFLKNQDRAAMKCMDAFEMTVRGEEDHENFCMDACIDSLELSVDIRANGRKTYEALRAYHY